MSTHPHFERWQDLALAKGQHALSDTLRELLYRLHPEVFERMDFDDDHAFLAPELFAHFTLQGEGADLPALLSRAEDQTSRAPLLQGHGHIPTLFAKLFTAEGHAMPRSPSLEWTRHHQGCLLRAQHLLWRHCPALARRLRCGTREVYLFRAVQPNSFASMSAHGAVFFNVPEGADEVFFLEDLAHQCAHVAFNAMTHDKARYLRVPPHTPLRQVVAHDNEERTVYTVLHALYTYVVISEVLATVLDAEVLDTRQMHEARGRLAYTLLKFRIDLQHMRRTDLYTHKGLLLYRRFSAWCAHQTMRNAAYVKGLDLSSQPYNFSYPLFVQSNPLEEMPMGAA